MLAGPAELVVLAHASADPEVIAADLLAQMTSTGAPWKSISRSNWMQAFTV